MEKYFRERKRRENDRHNGKKVCHDNKINVRVVSLSIIKTFLRTVDVFSYVARKIKKRTNKNERILKVLMSTAL